MIGVVNSCKCKIKAPAMLMVFAINYDFIDTKEKTNSLSQDM